jgi:uncharacterized protein YheU (UPF0270 family)
VDEPDIDPAPLLEGGEPIIVPYRELSASALQGVIESFVLREGTEYGATDFSLDQKVAHVMRQLERKEAHVVFDPDSESVNIVVSR